MSREDFRSGRGRIGSATLLLTIVVIAGALVAWKSASLRDADLAAANQPEPVESVTAAIATQHFYRETTTSIGTVRALRSITLRNELAGTVRQVSLTPGQIVDAGTVLVALDVSVEQADLEAEEAETGLAETTLARLEQLGREGAASTEEVDQARAQRDVALATIARTRAIIERKTIRAPFPARVGIADVHIGQYLNEGTELTTLQGVADAVHVDFEVSQQVLAGLRTGQSVEIFTNAQAPVLATIVALDARVDPITRNAAVRARIGGGPDVPPPGASVRVVVPVGPETAAVLVPASALRKGPGGDYVFVLAQDEAGSTRAHVRTVASGPLLGDDIVIVRGLEAGERIAASGSFKLREGALVAAQDPTTASSGTDSRAAGEAP